MRARVKSGEPMYGVWLLAANGGTLRLMAE